MSQNWQLTAKRGQKKGASWPISTTPLTIGRSEVCDVVVRDSLVSREHCRISLHGDRVICEDLGSSNCTLINGKAVAYSQLYLSDELSVGRAVFMLTKVSQSNAGTSTPFPRMTTVKLAQGLASEDGPFFTLESVEAKPRDVSDLSALHDLANELSGCPDRAGIGRVVISYVEKHLPVTDCCWIERANPNRGLSIEMSGRSFNDYLERECEAYLDETSNTVGVGQIPNKAENHVYCCLPIELHGAKQAVLGLEFVGNRQSELESNIGFAMCITQAAAPYMFVPSDNPELEVSEPTRPQQPVAGEVLIGQSAAMCQVRRMVGFAAKAELPVLIHGETGVGKELVATLLHQASARSEKQCVAVNCAAIQGSLFESEMFGHRRGAFTGAVQDKPGLLDEADGGILFLDEVGELDFGNQARLLRAIESGVFRPVGATSDVRVNVWIIGATNRNLLAAVQDGSFRSDLYFRLSGFEIEIPPLRKRIEDLPELVEYFVNESTSGQKSSSEVVRPELLTFLTSLPWPGNVRELRNVVQRTLVVAGNEPVAADDLRTIVKAQLALGSGDDRSIENLEREHILKILDECNGHIGHAAKLLGVHRNTMTAKLRKFGLKT